MSTAGWNQTTGSRRMIDERIMPAVLIISGEDDWSARRIEETLHQRNVSVTRLDTGEFPRSITMDARFDGTWVCQLDDGIREVDLDHIRAVYYRRPNEFRVDSALSRPEQRFARAQARVAVSGVLSSLKCRWINHPGAMAADNKPRQLSRAAACGFPVPRSLISNSTAAAREFCASVGNVVLKPLAQPVIAEAEGYSLVYSRRIDIRDIDSSANIDTTGHYFQEWIPKEYEVRLTVVGEQVFAVSIYAESDAAYVDWRSDYDNLRYEVISTPDHIRQSVLTYMTDASLTYSAFDFVVRPDREWVFLESNSFGQWGWLAEECRLPIADAIADELSKE